MTPYSIHTFIDKPQNHKAFFTYHSLEITRLCPIVIGGSQSRLRNNCDECTIGLLYTCFFLHRQNSVIFLSSVFDPTPIPLGSVPHNYYHLLPEFHIFGAFSTERSTNEMNDQRHTIIIIYCRNSSFLVLFQPIEYKTGRTASDRTTNGTQLLSFIAGIPHFLCSLNRKINQQNE